LNVSNLSQCIHPSVSRPLVYTTIPVLFACLSPQFFLPSPLTNSLIKIWGVQQCRRICERSIGLLSCTLHTSSNPAAHSSHDSHNLPYLLPGRGHPIPSHPIPSLWCKGFAGLLHLQPLLILSLPSIGLVRFPSGLCASAPPLARLSASLEPPQSSLVHSAVSQLPSLSIRSLVYPSVRPSGWFAGCLSVCPSVYLSVHPVHLSICQLVGRFISSALLVLSPLPVSLSFFSLARVPSPSCSRRHIYTRRHTHSTHTSVASLLFPSPLSRSHSHTVRVVAVSNPHITPIEL
jgi:hypothetical protein